MAWPLILGLFLKKQKPVSIATKIGKYLCKKLGCSLKLRNFTILPIVKQWFDLQIETLVLLAVKHRTV